MLGNLSSAKMLRAEFLKLAFSSFLFSKNTIRIADCLDPDETPRSVASYLDPNYLQRPLKFGSRTERVKPHDIPVQALLMQFKYTETQSPYLTKTELSPHFPHVQNGRVQSSSSCSYVRWW